MNNMVRIKTDPVLPIKCVATAGGTNPADASLDVMGSIRAVDVNPRDVAREKGIANQQIPPSKYPLEAEVGLAAMADCQ
jgi:hypothetical protein